MKKIFNFLILPIALNSFPLTVAAQNGQVCFMLDANGNPLDLSHLCQNSTRNSTPASAIRQNLPQATYDRGVYSVPIKSRRAGIPVIDVKFNNKYVFEMMLDTGASLTVLTKAMARVMNIKPEGSLPIQTPSDYYLYVPWSQVKSVSTAGIVSKQVDIVISPSLDMGLLGQNFFGVYDITIKQDVIEFRER